MFEHALEEGRSKIPRIEPIVKCPFSSSDLTEEELIRPPRPIHKTQRLG
jgi:hypothetical protein